VTGPSEYVSRPTRRPDHLALENAYLTLDKENSVRQDPNRHVDTEGDLAKETSADARAGRSEVAVDATELLFGLFRSLPTFWVRAAVFLERQECRLEPPKDGEYAFGEEERRAIARAFLRAFPEGGGAVPVEDDEGEILAGEAAVEAEDVPRAWNGAMGNLLEELSEEEAVVDARGALSALDLLRMEMAGEVWEDLVAQAFSAGEPPAKDGGPE
jgi:hypothetical protein